MIGGAGIRAAAALAELGREGRGGTRKRAEETNAWTTKTGGCKEGGINENKKSGMFSSQVQAGTTNPRSIKEINEPFRGAEHNRQ